MSELLVNGAIPPAGQGTPLVHLYIDGGRWEPEQSLSEKQEQMLALAQRLAAAFADHARTVHVDGPDPRMAFPGVTASVHCLVQGRVCAVECRLSLDFLTSDPARAIELQTALMRRQFDEFVAHTPPPLAEEEET